eukprot:3543780-Prymnesium_polylepis.2
MLGAQYAGAQHGCHSCIHVGRKDLTVCANCVPCDARTDVSAEHEQHEGGGQRAGGRVDGANHEVGCL